jgi:UDP-N-acetylglucosamine diphosphorylase / glucose-1-phosphate thymidylyltransferase / UDP-N-acetylgalactosamine diphosphorylase / glucosamine-1-phosphate N-acetyltransferase / galactosamine-1-phosphate N-acetyltransferase
LGSEVNLAAGVILANFKNGSKNLEVSSEVDGKKTPTGLQKLGALIGDGTKIGSNAVTDPGTIVGKNCLIYPLSLIRGTIESNKIVKNKPKLEIVDKE